MKARIQPSPIIRLYGRRGLVANQLGMFSEREKRLVLYRNFVRLLPFFYAKPYFKGLLHRYIQFRFLDDFNYRRAKLLGTEKVLDEEELLERAINTLNFFSNACIVREEVPADQSDDKSDANYEFNILNSLLMFESSKLSPRLKEFHVSTLDDFAEYKVQNSVNNKLLALDTIPSGKWYRYVDELRKSDKEVPSKKRFFFGLVRTILTYESSVMRMNEQSKLML